MEAVRLTQQGWSTRKVARHLGYDHTAVMGWIKKAEHLPSNAHLIPTESSRPHHHPRALRSEIISRILTMREEKNQCAELVHHRLEKEGVTLSLSSVKRTLKRHGLTKYSKWKKWHEYPERPLPEKPGVLVQTDTIWDGDYRDRLYLYTLLDVCTRWAYAIPAEKISAGGSVRFVYEAEKESPFSFLTIQSDHGSEFSLWFTKKLKEQGISHRHSRVRTPTDNGHLERFNRTIQEECLRHTPKTLSSYKKAINDYLYYYNNERPHMGLNMKTPMEVVRSY